MEGFIDAKRLDLQNCDLGSLGHRAESTPGAKAQEAELDTTYVSEQRVWGDELEKGVAAKTRDRDHLDCQVQAGTVKSK